MHNITTDWIHLALHLCISLIRIPKLSWGSAINSSFLSFCIFCAHSSISRFIEWGFGQSSVAPLSALLKALLRWWWKDLSNGITHDDKCSESGGSSLLPPTFRRIAFIRCAVAFLRNIAFWGDALLAGRILVDRYTHITDCLSSCKFACVFTFYFKGRNPLLYKICPGFDLCIGTNPPLTWAADWTDDVMR